MSTKDKGKKIAIEQHITNPPIENSQLGKDVQKVWSRKEKKKSDLVSRLRVIWVGDSE